jgi:hypothetical protein
MRYGSPPPQSAKTDVIRDGYQLCARCGKVMTNGETAIVVPRTPMSPIYSHPTGSQCPPKAVRGWKAALRAEGVRDSPNVLTPRPAEPAHVGGVQRELTCILDDKHIEAELKPLNATLSDETPLRFADIRSLTG